MSDNGSRTRPEWRRDGLKSRRLWIGSDKLLRRGD
jgi:hypothetical protein